MIVTVVDATTEQVVVIIILIVVAITSPLRYSFLNMGVFLYSHWFHLVLLDLACSCLLGLAFLMLGVAWCFFLFVVCELRIRCFLVIGYRWLT